MIFIMLAYFISTDIFDISTTDFLHFWPGIMFESNYFTLLSVSTSCIINNH